MRCAAPRLVLAATCCAALRSRPAYSAAPRQAPKASASLQGTVFSARSALAQVGWKATVVAVAPRSRWQPRRGTSCSPAPVALHVAHRPVLKRLLLPPAHHPHHQRQQRPPLQLPAVVLRCRIVPCPVAPAGGGHSPPPVPGLRCRVARPEARRLLQPRRLGLPAPGVVPPRQPRPPLAAVAEGRHRRAQLAPPLGVVPAHQMVGRQGGSSAAG